MRISDWSSDVCSSDLKITATGAKVVTLGDTAQTKAVEAGRAFALLQEQGMKTVIMGDIQRQKSERLRRDRQSAVKGKSVVVRVDHGGSRCSKKTNHTRRTTEINTSNTTKTKQN